MPTLATLCYIIEDGKVLLQEKKRGIGAGNINAPGGKFEEGEAPQDCVVREVFEETGLRISDLKNHGILHFFFGQRNMPDWIVHVFSTKSFQGELKESEEGKPKWFDTGEIPYDKMWKDDKYWIPLMLAGKNFQCWFYFDKDIKELLDYKIEIR